MSGADGDAVEAASKAETAGVAGAALSFWRGALSASSTSVSVACWRLRSSPHSGGDESSSVRSPGDGSSDWLGGGGGKWGGARGCAGSDPSGS